jgi:hypothetical protein
MTVILFWGSLTKNRQREKVVAYRQRGSSVEKKNSE